MPELPLFVYGTLRHGEANHRLLAGTYDRWLPAALSDFRRGIAAHGFPVIRPAVGESVEGELYFPRAEAYASALSRCDELEGIAPGRMAGEHYCRAEVQVETAAGQFAAWAYVGVTV